MRLHVDVDPAEGDRYRGDVEIDLALARPVRSLFLHAADLRVAKARLELAGRERRGRTALHPEAQLLEIAFDAEVPEGAATLRLAFQGRLRRDLCGLYGARVGERRYAFTQLEPADARRFFPCFDEPALKARFRMSVTTGRGNVAVSNAPVEKTEPAGDGRLTYHFAETPPLSTYLVALAVGELEHSRAVHVGPTEIRTWHAPGKGRLVDFGLEAAAECLARLEKYFGLPYPYAKLDLVAVPDFEFGAMENAGAVFFRETLLLLDPETASLAERKRAAEVICHELAHMWYGDLVTMAWWDDLWLNEAFATWMAFHVVDAWKPEWKMWHDFQHGRLAALELDGLRHTHPIYADVRTPEEANENFDLITYEKGASVVRMLERYLGPATFRRGVRGYIRRHREGNAVAADLWRALAEASGEDVSGVARGWIEQEGHPVVSVRRVLRDGRPELVLRQERYLERPPTPSGRAGKKGGAAQRWPIPWVGRVGSGRRGAGRLEKRLLTRVGERVPLDASPRFVYGNAEEAGFFRPLHSDGELRALAAHLGSLTAVERMGLVDHQWALVRGGRSGLPAFLELAGAFGDEPDPDVLLVLRKPLGFLARFLVPDAAPECADTFRVWVLDRFGAAFVRLGWDPGLAEPEETSVRRGALLGLVGGVGAWDEVLEVASERCAAYLRDRRSLEANLADPVVTLAARAGDEDTWHALAHAMGEAGTPQEKRRFLLALGEFRDRRLVDRSLKLALGDRVATQDVVFLLLRLLANPDARERTWEFVKTRWTSLRRRMPPLLASRLVESSWHLLTPDHRRDVARFFAEHPVPAGERALRQSLERFDWYRGFRGTAARELARFLAD